MKIKKLQLPKNWALITLLNLLIAALMGFILRYKMSFPLDIVNYEHLLHAHSHFVFHAWASLALMCSFIIYLLPKEKSTKASYGWIFWLMMLSSFGMIVSFIIQGYGFYSIFFSTLAQVVFYWFIIQFIKDGKDTIKDGTIKFFAFASLISLFISTLGPYFIAYFTATGAGTLFTRGSLYFYLHFQYNGWFTFAMLTLFFKWCRTENITYNESYFRWVAILFAVGVIPGFALSIIGDVSELWVVYNAIFAVITKNIAVVLLFLGIYPSLQSLKSKLSYSTKILWILSAFALFSKSIMDSLSLNPELVRFVFSFRPLVIGYLHLVFLVMLTFFLFGYYFEKGLLKVYSKQLSIYSIYSFIIFVLLSEISLFLQGFSAYFKTPIPLLIEINLFATAFILISLFLFYVSQLKYLKLNNINP